MTTAIDEAPPQLNAGTGRIGIMLAAALLPLMLALALSGLFHLAGDYTVSTHVAAKTTFASITYPRRDTPVGQTFTAKGELTQLPADTSAYLMVKRDERYWPKKALGNKMGAWSQSIKETIRKRSKLYLVVLALTAQDKALIDQWYADSKASGKYPGITQFTAAQEIAAIEVKQQ